MPLSADSGPLLFGLIYVAILLLAGYAIVCFVLGQDQSTGTQLFSERPTVRHRHWAELFGLSFTAGSGAVSFILFFASLAGFAPSRGILIAIATVGAAGILVMSRRNRLLSPAVPTPHKKIDPLFFLGIAAAVTLIAAAYNVQARSAWPGLGDIDAFAIWMFKAKWVALAPLCPLPAVFHDPGLSYSHQDYPLALPFLVAGAYALGGGISEELAKTLLLPQYLALIAIIYSALRYFHRRALAVTVTAIFAAAPVLNRNAGLMVAETPLILAYSACLAMLLRWMEIGARRELILAGFFAAVAAFTKNEGLALMPVIGVMALSFALIRRTPIPPALSRRKLLIDWFISCTFAAALIAPWLVLRSFLPRTHEDYGGKLRSAATIFHNLPRLSQIVPYILSQMRDAQNAGLIWYVLAITALVGWRAFLRLPVLILWAILLLQLSLYAATFVVTPWPLHTLLAMITPKLLAQTTPAAALLIGLHLRKNAQFRSQTDQENAEARSATLASSLGV